MEPSTLLFLIHTVCYWYMVYLYDDKQYDDFKPAVLNSLKNQIFVSYPVINIVCRYYPINYNNFILSFAYIPILMIIGDIYFY